MSSPDPRPRPQYGEYASPEEQQARIRQPAPEWSNPHVPSAEPEAVADQNPPHEHAAAPAAPASSPASVSRPRILDRIITAALLGYGLVNVVSSFVAMLDYGTYAQTVLDAMGIDATLSDPDAGRGWGLLAGTVLVVGWLITAALSWWSIRRGRLTWWIPIVGGIVFTVLAAVFMVIPIMSDPAVWDALVVTPV